MNQPSLFDKPAAEAERDEAVDRVERGADERFREAALEIVTTICQGAPEFTTDRVHYLLQRRGIPAPREPRALGAVMREARRQGLCEPTDRTTQSVRPECHARPVRIWRSQTYAASRGGS